MTACCLQTPQKLQDRALPQPGNVASTRAPKAAQAEAGGVHTQPAHQAGTSSAPNAETQALCMCMPCSIAYAQAEAAQGNVCRRNHKLQCLPCTSHICSGTVTDRRRSFCAFVLTDRQSWKSSEPCGSVSEPAAGANAAAGREPGGGEAAQQEVSGTVFVRGLPLDASQFALQDRMSRFGRVKSCRRAGCTGLLFHCNRYSCFLSERAVLVTP